MTFAYGFCGLVIIDAQSSLPYNSPAMIFLVGSATEPTLFGSQSGST
jgi:hypothetical protein